MLSDNLKSMLYDIDKTQKEKKDLEYFINLRLDKSIQSYYHDIMNSFNSLSNKQSLNVMKKYIKD